MNEPVTISSPLTGSRGACLEHNQRDFTAWNVDAGRTENNVFLKQYEPLEQVYEQLFGAALTRYNEKQKRADRRIDSYLQKIRDEEEKEERERTEGKADGTKRKAKNGRKSFYEIIFQIGREENFGLRENPENAELAKEVLAEYYLSFVERNPNLYVFGCVIHMDEATPHMHLDFVPVATGYKQGLDTQTSFSRALQQQGIPAAEKYTELEGGAWIKQERAELKRIAESRGIEIEELHTDPRERLSVAEYKLQRTGEDLEEAQAQLAEAEAAKREAEKNAAAQEAALAEKSRQVTQLDRQIDRKETRLETLKKDIKSYGDVSATYDEIDSMGQKTITGKIQLTQDEAQKLKDLAKGCLRRSATIWELKREIDARDRTIMNWEQKYRHLEEKYSSLLEKTEDFLAAVKKAPQRVTEFIRKILAEPERKREEKTVKKRRSGPEL